MTPLEIARYQLLVAAERIVMEHESRARWLQDSVEQLDAAKKRVIEEEFKETQAANAALAELLSTPPVAE